MKIKILIIIAVLFTYVVSDAQITVIKGGKIYSMTQDSILYGDLIIIDDTISAVGPEYEIPENAIVINAANKIVMPGLIDSYCHLGLREVSEVPQTVDMDETSNPITPEVRVIDAFNTQSELIPVTRIEGVTTVLSAPGKKNVISGQSAIVNLAGENIDDMMLKSPAALHINITEKTINNWRERKIIDSRMGLVAKLRQAFIDGREYEYEWKRYHNKLAKFKANSELPKNKHDDDLSEPERPERDLGKEVIVQALNKQIPVIASAMRKDDILTAVRIADEFGLNLIILNGTDAYKVADLLKSKQIPVLVGPITTQPSSMENLGAIYENAAILYKSGVKIAIITGSAHNIRDLRFQAGIAAQYGLPYYVALKAITVNPAEILGISDNAGSITVGKTANIVIFDGDPLQPLTKISDVIIKGRRIPLESYQTEIYEKFK